MPILIKEVIVKTTVERNNPQWLQPNDDLIVELKQKILDELRMEKLLKGEQHGKERRRR